MENYKPKKIKELLSKIFDNETVIVRKSDWKCFILNSTGTYIWKLLNKKKSIKDIINLLSIKYKIDKKRAKKDTIAFLNYLKKLGLIYF